MQRRFFVSIFLTLFVCQAQAETPIPLQCLWSAYKNFKISADKTQIVFPSGRTVRYQSSKEEIAHIDPFHLTALDQMFLTPYPQGPAKDPPQKKDSLRGARFGPFFKVVYGSSPDIVKDDMELVRWVDGSELEFNRFHGASAHLRDVVKDLKKLIKDHPEYKKYVQGNIGGTYNWRPISHQHDMSLHSYGIAIDINLNYADYWRWEINDSGKFRYKNRIPMAIVQIFEKNGFIWGGKWYHYDTMHFEYRPELLIPQKDCESQFAEYRD